MSVDSLFSSHSCVVFDVETTGFGNDPRIVEIAAIRLEDWEPVEEFHTLVNPEMPIPWSASKVHQITDGMVSDAPTFAEIAPRLGWFFQDAVALGHNIFSYDLRVLQKHLRAWFGAGLAGAAVDTLPLARKLLPLENHRLATLAAHFSVPLDAHQAMSDVYATTEIWYNLAQKVQKAGAFALRDLQRWGAFRILDGSGLPRYSAPPDAPLKKRPGSE